MGRLLVCAIALGWTAPAWAGDRPIEGPSPDTLSMLMRDDRAVFSTAVTPTPVVTPIHFDMRTGPVALIGTEPAPIDLPSFNRLRVPARDYLPLRAEADNAPGFSSYVLGSDPVTPPEWRLAWRRPAARYVFREVVRDGMANAGKRRRFRHGSPFDSFLTLRLDGREETPVMGMRGAVTGAIWHKLQ